MLDTGNSNSAHTNLIQPTICVNFIYDLNGRKGPNKVNKDIGFITAFYPSDSVIAAPVPIKPVKLSTEIYDDKFNSYCPNEINENAKVANIEDLMAIFVNMMLVDDISNDAELPIHNYAFKSSTKTANGYKVMVMYSGALSSVTIPSSGSYFMIYCVLGR